MKMSEDPGHHRRWPLIWALVIGILLLIIFGGHWLWSMGAQHRLNRQLAEYSAAGEPIELSDFVVKDVPDPNNAAIDLRAAARSIDNSTETFQEYEKPDFALPLTDKERKLIGDVAAANKAAFAGVDQAMTKSQVDWQIPWKSPGVTVLLPDLSEQRRLAVLMANHALLSHQAGDDRAAIKDIERIWFIAEAVGEQPILVSNLVSLGCRARACSCVEAIAPDLKIGTGPEQVTPAELKRLIALLLDERKEQTSRKRALFGERAIELDAARGITSGSLSLSNFTGRSGPPARPNAAGAFVGYAIRPMAIGDGLMMIRYTTGINKAASEAKNWPAFVASKPSIPAEVTSRPYLHVVASMLLPNLDRSVFAYFHELGQSRMAAVTLAIALYRHDHDGKWPARLEDLAPAYLPQIPDDPMSAAGKLKYVAATTQPIVYSVGENGVDDGGNDRPGPTRFGTRSRVTLDDVTHLTRRPREASGDDEPQTVESAPATSPATTQSATSQPTH